MDIDYEALLQSFLTESEEGLVLMEEALMVLERQPHDAEALGTVFRVAHTIKGTAAMFDFATVEQLAHGLEELLDRLRDGSLPVTSDLVSLLLRAVDALRELIPAAAAGREAMGATSQSVLDQLHHHASPATTAPETDSAGTTEPVTDPITDGALASTELATASPGQAPALTVNAKDTTDVEIAALLPLFQAESEESLARMEEALIVLERQPQDQEAVAASLRIAHTIKGNSAFFRLADIEHYAHAIEEVLAQLRTGSIEVTGELVSLLLRAVDGLKENISEASVGDQPMMPAPAILEQLRHAANGDVAADTVVNRLPAGADAKSSESAARFTTRASTSLRVDLERLDRLLNLTGEIGIARSQLAQKLEEPEHSRAAVLETLHEADFIHLELQELVMKLRMVPVGPAFRRYRRTVRDLARAHGKVARLVTEGEEVEVDATVIEHLRDPLTHMVRNALDHGIEPPAVRTAAGKDPCGVLTLRAWHEAGSIVIELADDGAGLDRERVLQRARSAGIVPDGGSLTDQQIEQLIFEPGFTTAETVTDLSGRGVGMDVVRRNIETLRGSVAVTSQRGKGTAITLRLPLTLAIIDGLTVRVASEIFFIPLETVVESVELPADEPQRADGRGVLSLRDTALPYVRLRHLFGLEGAPPARENVIVVERPRQQLAGLVVDALLGQSQAVIKPLARLFRGLPGISGSTILGSGRVALILDLPSLLQLAESTPTATLELR